MFTNITESWHKFEKRIHFDSFDSQNDTHPATGKPGIRCHNWFTAFFLTIFNKIETINTDKGVIYLNKASFNEWLEAKKQTLMPNTRALPSAQEIIEAHKRSLNPASEDESEDAAAPIHRVSADQIKIQPNGPSHLEKNAGAIRLQSQIRSFLVQARFEELKKLTQDIHNAEQAIQSLTDAYNAQIEALNVQTKTAQATKGQLKAELDNLEIEGNSIQTPLNELKEQLIKLENQNPVEEALNDVVNFFKQLDPNAPKAPPVSKEELKNQIAALEKKYKEITESIALVEGQLNANKAVLEDQLPKELEKSHTDYQQKQTVQSQALTELKNKKDQLLNQITALGHNSAQTSPTTPAEPAVPTTQEPEIAPPASIPSPSPASARIPTPAEKMLEDITTRTAPELAVAMGSILKKLGPDVVSKWTFNSNPGDFSLTLKSPYYLWMRPIGRKGTPKGVVMILDRQIKGKLDTHSKMITFTQGFRSFCAFQQGIIRGEADGKIDAIRWVPETQELELTVTGTIKGLFSITKTVQQHTSLDNTIEDWTNATIVQSNYEEFLRNQDDAS